MVLCDLSAGFDNSVGTFYQIGKGVSIVNESGEGNGFAHIGPGLTVQLLQLEGCTCGSGCTGGILVHNDGTQSVNIISVGIGHQDGAAVDGGVAVFGGGLGQDNIFTVGGFQTELFDLSAGFDNSVGAFFQFGEGVSVLNESGVGNRLAHIDPLVAFHLLQLEGRACGSSSAGSVLGYHDGTQGVNGNIDFCIGHIVTIDHALIALHGSFRDGIYDFHTVLVLVQIRKAPCPAIFFGHSNSLNDFFICQQMDGNGLGTVAVLVVVVVPGLHAGNSHSFGRIAIDKCKAIFDATGQSGFITCNIQLRNSVIDLYAIFVLTETFKSVAPLVIGIQFCAANFLVVREENNGNSLRTLRVPVLSIIPNLLHMNTHRINRVLNLGFLKILGGTLITITVNGIQSCLFIGVNILVRTGDFAPGNQVQGISQGDRCKTGHIFTESPNKVLLVLAIALEVIHCKGCVCSAGGSKHIGACGAVIGTCQLACGINGVADLQNQFICAIYKVKVVAFFSCVLITDVINNTRTLRNGVKNVMLDIIEIHGSGSGKHLHEMITDFGAIGFRIIGIAVITCCLKCCIGFPSLVDRSLYVHCVLICFRLRNRYCKSSFRIQKFGGLGLGRILSSVVAHIEQPLVACCSVILNQSLYIIPESTPGVKLTRHIPGSISAQRKVRLRSEIVNIFITVLSKNRVWNTVNFKTPAQAVTDEDHVLTGIINALVRVQHFLSHGKTGIDVRTAGKRRKAVKKILIIVFRKLNEIDLLVRGIVEDNNTNIDLGAGASMHFHQLFKQIVCIVGRKLIRRGFVNDKHDIGCQRLYLTGYRQCHIGEPIVVQRCRSLGFIMHGGAVGCENGWANHTHAHDDGHYDCHHSRKLLTHFSFSFRVKTID